VESTVSEESAAFNFRVVGRKKLGDLRSIIFARKQLNT
jgi:hypothetical protein